MRTSRLDDPACGVASDVGALLDAAAKAAEHAGASIDRAARPGVNFDEVWNVGLPLVSAATTPSRTDEDFAKQVAIADDESLDKQRRMRANATALRHRDWLLLVERREEHRRRWAAFFESYDVLLCPVAASAAFPHLHEGGLYTRNIEIDGIERPYADLVAWTSFIGYVHLPSTVVPIGLTPSGLPVGIQVVAPFMEDRTALRFARHLESLLGGYQVPPMAQLAG